MYRHLVHAGAPRFAGVLALVVGFGVASGASAGPASLMIWPIHPVIRHGERATALWLENRGTNPVTVQVRVLGWTQAEYADRYQERPDGLVASPPLATVDPGRRQLVRLTKLIDAPAGQELAYRVLIDELPGLEPAGGTSASAGEAAMGVRFRMRYSLPLFVYGHGLDPAAIATDLNEGALRQSAAVSWRVATAADGRWLEMKNGGPTHVRLSHVRFVTAGTGFHFAPGLLGYLLPGAEMRWRLPDEAPIGDHVALEARLNGMRSTPVARD